jgi:hypothetical protein
LGESQRRLRFPVCEAGAERFLVCSGLASDDDRS